MAAVWALSFVCVLQIGDIIPPQLLSLSPASPFPVVDEVVAPGLPFLPGPGIAAQATAEMLAGGVGIEACTIILLPRHANPGGDSADLLFAF